jgi:urease alpha subunit
VAFQCTTKCYFGQVRIDNYTILKSTTIPAQFFDEQNEWGSVEVDKVADLILKKST